MTNTEMKLLAAVRASWKCMCEHDNVPVDSQFVVFSESNPYAKAYNTSMSKFLAYRRQFHAAPATKAVR